MARTALHDDVLDALGRRIVGGELAVGAVLTLDIIDTEHDVSRSVSREAVRVLESMGMVASRRRVGVTVQPRTSWHVFDPRLIRWRLDSDDRAAQLRSLGELRSGFEPVAAGLAAERATPEQCGALATAASDMVVHGRSGDLEAFLQADVAFHRILLEASGNEMLAALDGVVAEVLAGRTHHHLMPTHPKDEAVDLHVEVARAVRSGDVTGARAAMAAIISEATGAIDEDPTTLG
ncbi:MULTISPECIES: FadR/GntR family transcriptional regulator [unclassified Nocardioides]|uniref:FadR/GntR family transcriptional regulator n=1 Tax=unclassified Nocardioides TaxID=2615069 RepID=UPI000AE80B27|nr:MULTISPECIES: FCD domain-containing protein [unclassified Nocardioides]